MKRQAALLSVKQPVLSPKSDLWRHVAVRPLADLEAPLAERQGPRVDGHNFSRVPVHAFGTDGGHTEVSCPQTPRRCPLGGACHSCPAHVQPKLKISQPDDGYEREADRVADAVMRMPELKESETATAFRSLSGEPEQIDRKDAGSEPDPYAEERKLTKGLGPDASIYLLFDGKSLIIRSPKKDLAWFPAVSGRDQSRSDMNVSVNAQKSKGQGPIPAGVYWLDLRQKTFVIFGRGAWGPRRLTIHPFPGTQTFGRGGFFIHGGAEPGSAGCIDLTANVMSFFDLLEKFLAIYDSNKENPRVRLHVIYPRQSETGSGAKLPISRSYSAQRAESFHESLPVSTTTREVLRSPGQSLDMATQAFMESRFNRDLSHVRVHTGAQADESAHSLDALAYTAGNDIVFRTGRYSPTTEDGRRLLAHELTHVVQQGQSGCVYRSVVDDRRSKIVETALGLTEEHYLMGAAGEIPDRGGGISGRSVTLNSTNHAASIGVYWGKERGTVTYVCGGRYGKVTALPVGDSENKEHQSSPEKYRWKRGSVYGEACEGKRHFDCGGFVSYCYHQACPEVAYPGPASGLLTGAYGWQSVSKDAVKAGDVAYRPGDPKHPDHAGLCTSSTEVVHASSRESGVKKGSVGSFSKFGRLKCLVEPTQPTRPEKPAESKSGPESSTSPSASPERGETELSWASVL